MRCRRLRNKGYKQKEIYFYSRRYRVKKNPIASVINDNFKVEFVGNVLIFGHSDDYGELTGLTKQDIKDILTLQFKIYDNKKDFHYGLIIKSV